MDFLLKVFIMTDLTRLRGHLTRSAFRAEVAHASGTTPHARADLSLGSRQPMHVDRVSRGTGGAWNAGEHEWAR